MRGESSSGGRKPGVQTKARATKNADSIHTHFEIQERSILSLTKGRVRSSEGNNREHKSSNVAPYDFARSICGLRITGASGCVFKSAGKRAYCTFDRESHIDDWSRGTNQR